MRSTDSRCGKASSAPAAETRRLLSKGGTKRKRPKTRSLPRYDAALELCPQHKEGLRMSQHLSFGSKAEEGLVGRGAALTNLGKPREACRMRVSECFIDFLSRGSERL